MKIDVYHEIIYLMFFSIFPIILRPIADFSDFDYPFFAFSSSFRYWVVKHAFLKTVKICVALLLSLGRFHHRIIMPNTLNLIFWSVRTFIHFVDFRIAFPGCVYVWPDFRSTSIRFHAVQSIIMIDRISDTMKTVCSMNGVDRFRIKFHLWLNVVSGFKRMLT